MLDHVAWGGYCKQVHGKGGGEGQDRLKRWV